jgi:lysophospholipase L1-like esterase
MALLGAVVTAPTHVAAQREPRWFSAWTVAHNVGEVVPDLDNTTVRMIVRPTIAGQALRIKLENTRARMPAIFTAAFVGVVDTGAAVVRGTNRSLTFSGASRLTLAPGEGAWSDPVQFDVKAFERLAVSLDVASASDVSMHALGLVTNYSAQGARAAEPSAQGFAPISPTVPGSKVIEFPFYWLAAVDILSSSAVGTIVAVGDSWVDGRCSTTEKGIVKPDLHQRWVDVLAARLAAAYPQEPRAVVNKGIGGNRIIPGGGNGPAMLDRLDRDVLERAGATHVLYLQGMNDLGGGASAEQVTAGMQQVIDRVHAKGLSIIGGTLFALARPDLSGWTSAYDAKRSAVNTWIRTRANFDAVVDFDRMMSGGPVYDGSASLKPEFACDGDNVHPNAAAYKAMGELVDLALFKSSKK